MVTRENFNYCFCRVFWDIIELFDEESQGDTPGSDHLGCKEFETIVVHD